MRRLTLALVVLAAGCRPAPEPAVVSSPVPATTDPAIAVGNLIQGIASVEELVAAGTASVGEISGLIDQVSMRGQFLGRIADYEKADALAERLVAQHPKDAAAWLARARTRSTFHRFDDALSDAARAEQCGADRSAVAGVRAGVAQARGRYAEALATRRAAAEGRPGILTIGNLATFRGEEGDAVEAARLFAQARTVYRDVSPFPLAWLDFQEGRQLMQRGRMAEARDHFQAAHDRLPQYAAATGHLGETEAALGHKDVAIALLTEAASESDDPDPAGHLARVLAEVGRKAESDAWKAKAAARFEELLAAHPDAFADHAAEFWLNPGGDAQRALALARHNYTLRPTQAACDLLKRTLADAGATPSRSDAPCSVPAATS